MQLHDRGSSRDLLVAWAMLPFLTPARAHLLLEYFDSPSDVERAGARTLASLLNIPVAEAELVKHPLHLPAAQDAVRAWSPSAITLADEAYPPLLREIYDPPLALFYRGNAAALLAPSIAVVGSRIATPYGTNAAASLSRRLAERGVTVVSGLARGIDAAAHRATIDARGTTVAVLGTGIDVVYPRSHRRLSAEIEASGCLVTSFPPATQPLARHFPMRNRIISGLSLGTLVVEATGRSGSLITARLAAEQGREVFALPGSVFNATSEGPHRLIQYGAKLVHDVDDILGEIGALRHLAGAPDRREPLDERTAATLAAFSFDEGVHIDIAAERLGIPVSQLAGRLLDLELRGLLRPLPGARWVRAGS